LLFANLDATAHYEFLKCLFLLLYKLAIAHYIVLYVQEAVAVKCIAKSKLATESTTQQFLQEIDNLTTVDHPHVVQMFGVASSNDSFMLVTSLLLLCLLNQSVGDSSMLLCIISAHSAVGHFLLQA